jgi:hypothetical protein
MNRGQPCFAHQYVVNLTSEIRSPLVPCILVDVLVREKGSTYTESLFTAEVQKPHPIVNFSWIVCFIAEPMPSDYSWSVLPIISNSCIEVSHYHWIVSSMYTLHHFSQGFVEALFCFSRSCFRWCIALNERCWLR